MGRRGETVKYWCAEGSGDAGNVAAVGKERKAVAKEREEEGGAGEDVALTMKDKYFRKIMWHRFRTLGETRDRRKELQAGREILASFKKRMGGNGKFVQWGNGSGKAVSDETALKSEFPVSTAFVPSAHIHIVPVWCKSSSVK